MSKQDAAVLAGFLSVVLLAIRVLTVADDVQTIIEDPNQANKPREILKLVFDVSSLFMMNVASSRSRFELMKDGAP